MSIPEQCALLGYTGLCPDGHGICRVHGTKIPPFIHECGASGILAPRSVQQIAPTFRMENRASDVTPVTIQHEHEPDGFPTAFYSLFFRCWQWAKLARTGASLFDIGTPRHGPNVSTA